MTQLEPTKTETSLTVRRIVSAPRDRVYRAFADPKELAKWYAPGPMSATITSWDPAVGSDFEVTMTAGDESHTTFGTFTEVVPGEKLVHTWNWKGAEAPEDTIVTVELRDAEGGGTEVILTHEKLPGQQAVDDHVEGWMGCLEKLDAALA